MHPCFNIQDVDGMVLCSSDSVKKYFLSPRICDQSVTDRVIWYERENGIL